MNKNIRIGIAEDYDIVRQGLVHILNNVENFSVITEAANGSLILKKLRTHTIDVLILDLSRQVMGGFETLKKIIQRYPRVKVIVLNINHTDCHIVESIRVGARAFLPKETALEKLMDAVNSVYNHGYYFDHKVSKALLQQSIDNKEVKPNISGTSLTKREKDIVLCICEGNTNKEIAEKLFLSIRTVEVHRKNIAKKINSTNIAGVVIYAIKNGLYKI